MKTTNGKVFDQFNVINFLKNHTKVLYGSCNLFATFEPDKNKESEKGKTKLQDRKHT